MRTRSHGRTRSCHLPNIFLLCEIGIVVDANNHIPCQIYTYRSLGTLYRDFYLPFLKVISLSYLLTNVVEWDSTLVGIRETGDWMDLQDACDERLVSSHECTECDIGHSLAWELLLVLQACQPQPNRSYIGVVRLDHDL